MVPAIVIYRFKKFRATPEFSRNNAVTSAVSQTVSVPLPLWKQVLNGTAITLGRNNIFGTDLKEFLYFSLTSLTTMGYGDITPVYPLARSLANFEALIGQLYPAILIARLVTMEFESSSKRKEKM